MVELNNYISKEESKQIIKFANMVSNKNDNVREIIFLLVKMEVSEIKNSIDKQ